MAETEQVAATKAHLGMLVDVDEGKVHDRHLLRSGETPYLELDGEKPVRVAELVWDLERLGWCWRPADDPVWRLTDAGRQAMEDGQR
jgi:hypothetical protein